MAARVQGKVAIVTGAGSGIGRAMAKLFAAEGALVIVADVSGQEEETAREVGGMAYPFHVDVASEAQLDALVAATVERHGRIDILCNNAGASGGLVPTEDATMELWDRVIGVNLRGSFLLMQKCIREMLRTGGGAIVNTSSIAAVRGNSGTAAYTASKGGLMAITRVAAAEYAAHNIRVNALLPGVIASPMVARLSGEARERLALPIPMRRLGTVEEMAQVALFLASDEASYVTGVGLLADGGRAAV